MSNTYPDKETVIKLSQPKDKPSGDTAKRLELAVAAFKGKKSMTVDALVAATDRRTFRRAFRAGYLSA